MTRDRIPDGSGGVVGDWRGLVSPDFPVLPGLVFDFAAPLAFALATLWRRARSDPRPFAMTFRASVAAWRAAQLPPAMVLATEGQ